MSAPGSLVTGSWGRIYPGWILWANRRTATRALERLTDTSAQVPALESLMKWELEIADGVALGLHDIAQRSNISEATVKSHLNAIFRRLIEGRVALAMLAQERSNTKGLGPFLTLPPT